MKKNNPNNVLPPVETRFKPGQSGNPDGRPKLSPEIKRLRRMSQKEFAHIAEMVITGNWEDLEAMATNSKETVLRKKIAKGLLEEGYKTFDEIMNRIIGKVKDQVEVSVPKPTIIRRPSGETVILGSELEGDDED